MKTLVALVVTFFTINANAEFKLTIFKADGSIYWAPLHFNTSEEALKWIEQEKKSPTWNNTYTYSIVDLSPPPPTAEEIAAKLALEKERQDAQKAIDQFDFSKSPSSDELRDLFQNLLVASGMKSGIPKAKAVDK